MKVSSVYAPIVAALALSQGAEASFVGAAARAGAAAGKAGQAAAGAAKAAGAAAGRMGGAISNTIKNLPDPVKSGLTSGSVSGTIGGSVGLGVGLSNKNNKRMRRVVRSHQAIESEILKRDDLPDGFGPGEAPEGINQADWDRCYWDGLDANIVVTGPVDNGNNIQLDGLPASCMPLNLALDGNPAGGARPEPCGSSCLKYLDMSEEDYTAFAEIFESIRTV